MSSFELIINSPVGKQYSVEAEILTLKLKSGSAGIMANMAPVTSVVDRSIATLKTAEGKDLKVVFDDGIFVFEDNKANIVVSDFYVEGEENHPEEANLEKIISNTTDPREKARLEKRLEFNNLIKEVRS